jgi:IS4 transposase
MDVAMAMIESARLELPVDRQLGRLKANVFALDSTTIDLCLKLFPWAKFRRRKAGIKAHIMIDLLVGIPVFLRVTHAKTHDLWALDQIVPLSGAYYVFDKGYVDFGRLHRFHLGGSFFVTRAKKNMAFGVRQRRPIGGLGVMSDRIIRLRGPKSRRLYPDALRLIRYLDPESGKRFRFLTNNFALDAATIALLYRRRWRIELFFKWIKQHLHVKSFFGNTPNAVKTQLWVAVIVYVLVVKLKHSEMLPHDLNEIFQILSVTILERTPVFELFSEIHRSKIEDEFHKQLTLFD